MLFELYTRLKEYYLGFSKYKKDYRKIWERYLTRLQF